MSKRGRARRLSRTASGLSEDPVDDPDADPEEDTTLAWTFIILFVVGLVLVIASFVYVGFKKNPSATFGGILGGMFVK